MVSSPYSTRVRQGNTEVLASHEALKIEKLQSELETLRRERDEAKRLAKQVLEKAQKLSMNAVQGN